MRFGSKVFIAACLLFALFLSIWLRPVQASSSLTDSRINQLEFQVRSLQTQINQLQGQAPRQSSSGAPIRSDIGPAPNELSLDEQFDNLATLVIEINQRVIKLEENASARSN